MKPKILLYIAGILFMTSCVSKRLPCPCEASSVILLDGTELPKGLHAEIYAIRPSDMSFDGYESKFDKQLTDVPGGYMELTAINGPDWKPGTQVDLAVRLADDKGNRKYIKEDKVVIQKEVGSNSYDE